MTVISRLASPSVIIAASGVTAIAWRGERARFVVAAPLAFGAGKIAKWLLPTRKPKLFGRHAMQSFPSGHSGGSTAFGVSLALASKQPWAFGLAAAAMLAVNATRVAELEHSVRDCVVGDLIGIAAAIATHALVTSPSVRRRAQQLRARVARRSQSGTSES
jgi:membrane-associated phospholipid phosphatase